MITLRFIEARLLERALPVIAAIALVLLLGCTPGVGPIEHPPTEAGQAADSPRAEPTEARSHRYRLAPAPHDEEAIRDKSTPPPLVLRGRGTAGKIVNRQGETVMDAAKSGSIYGLELSPSRDKALVYFGDANYTVLDTDTLEEVADPPAKPPRYQDATGFSWWFLDDGRLIGQADLPSTDTAGKTAADIESLLPRSTLIYVYEFESDSLASVEIDGQLPSIFSIHEILGEKIILLTPDTELLHAALVRDTGI
ncbi:hypothetical protein QFW77_05685 [Luteimonas sp. RD2P54]|uniref:Uncharacterized protein n=1 Tax=Luteimonas endophytica TaxID=3042023 RepID=A0ABT6J6M8_9GAMM|nr:hypothetical protein [Luteimonas endophytica]MDH5822481.1 hypothetical protein [Luteimonas endophytica]